MIAPYTDRPYVAKVTERKTIDANRQSRSGLPIAQFPKPGRKSLGLANLDHCQLSLNGDILAREQRGDKKIRCVTVIARATGTGRANWSPSRAPPVSS